MGGAQVCTVGRIDLVPNLINVIAARATLTVDLRNTDEALLQEAEARLAAFLETLRRDEGVSIQAAAARALRAGGLRSGGDPLHRRRGVAARASASGA